MNRLIEVRPYDSPYADQGLSFLVGADVEPAPVPAPKETIGDALKKITPSIVILGVVTGLTVALGSAITQAAIGAFKKR